MIALCGPGHVLDRRRILYCPVEQRRRRMVVNYGGWWGVAIHCCGCGDGWHDGELLPRPFAPKWRDKQIARNKQRWLDAPAGPQPSLHQQGLCFDDCEECE